MENLPDLRENIDDSSENSYGSSVDYGEEEDHAALPKQERYVTLDFAFLTKFDKFFGKQDSVSFVSY